MNHANIVYVSSRPRSAAEQTFWIGSFVPKRRHRAAGRDDVQTSRLERYNPSVALERIAAALLVINAADDERKQPGSLRINLRRDPDGHCPPRSNIIMTRERIFRSTIVEAVLAGRQPPALSLATLMRPFPALWSAQRRGH